MDKVNEFNDTFFIVLNSNDSLNFHPNNNSSNFTIHYDKPIEFLKDMEVGLVEINISPNYIYRNVPKSSINIMFINEDYGKKHSLLWKINVEENYVTNTLEFLSYINEIISKITEDDYKKWIKQQFVELSDKYEDIIINYIILPKIKLKNNKIEISKGYFRIYLQHSDDKKWSRPTFTIYYEFDKNLNKIINFPNFEDSVNEQISLKEIELENLNNFIVCSDIIISSKYGNSMVPVLRLFDKSKVDKNETINFCPILFVPVNKHKFDSISIFIKDDNNRYINFVKSETSLVLLFRPLEHI